MLLLCPRTLAQSHCVLHTTLNYFYLTFSLQASSFLFCHSRPIYSPDDTCQPQCTASYLKKANFFLYTRTGSEVKQLGLCFRTRRRRAVSKRQEYTKITTMKEMTEDTKRKEEEERKKALLYCDCHTVSCFQVQTHQGFIQRPHSEILLHFRIKVTHSTLLHPVT